MSLSSRSGLTTAALAVLATVLLTVSPSPAAASRTIQCSLPHGAEGGVSLPFQATNISCSRGHPIVSKARLGPCNPTSASGCRVDGYVCRDSDPLDPGHVSAGDVIRCTKGRKAVQFGEPG
jgi:hypothetical protein